MQFFAGMFAVIIGSLFFFLKKPKKEDLATVKKEIKDEAQAITKKKTAGDIIADVNRRFPIEGSNDRT